jgi:hypothetical protein
MEHATSYRPDVAEGRWRIKVSFKGEPWEIIVEPVPEKQLLCVVTAYDVN